MNDLYLDDALLIQRFGNGDQSAFDTLIHRHQARAYQYAYRLTKDTEQAADIVALAFIKVFKSLATFKGESSFTTWLYRILTNCYLDARKKSMSRPTWSLDAPQHEDEGDFEREFSDPGLTPHEQAERGERELTIAEAVDQLPEYQKAMILMFHVELLTYEEMAEVLDVPIGTVKSRLNRARLTLKERLRDKEHLFLVA